MPNRNLYDTDYFAWATEQASLLSEGRLADADLPNLIEEIESMGRGEKRELKNRLAVLLLHLLKWCYQPEKRGRSWRATIRIQRFEIHNHLAANPSLKAHLPEIVAQAHEVARIAAAMETSLDEACFPTECPWTFEQIIAEDFWPEEPA